MGATEQLKQQTGLAKKPPTLSELLESLKPQVALALPRHLTPERMIRVAITCIKTTPKLMDCTPQSILASVMLASQLGLEPGVMGQCFLVPYKTTCTLIPGWLGLMDLVNRAGKAQAWTGAVYEGDEFDWRLGSDPYIVHRPCGEDDPAKLQATYGVGRLLNSPYSIIDVWDVKKIWKHRARFNKVGDRHYSYAHPEAYARKLPLLQVLKYIPRSIELATAYRLDDEAEMGHQNLKIEDVKGVIEGIVESNPDPESQVPTAPAEVVEEIDESQLMSKCKTHGLFPASLGNCPKCE